MRKSSKKLGLVVSAVAIIGAGCATGAQSGVTSSLVRLGLSNDRAKCVARQMNDRLDRRDLRDVANFLGQLDGSRSPGNVLDTLLTIDNPRAASAFARAGISCAF